MSRRLALSLVALLLPAQALAVARHEQVVLQKIRDPQSKQVIGFRMHALVMPEQYTKFRISAGKMAVDPALIPASQSVPNPHNPQTQIVMPVNVQLLKRDLGANVKPGYVRAQIHEGQVAAATPGQAHIVEVKADVLYGKGNDLKPGDKVDILSAFNSAANVPYWHIFGMFDGPVQRGDAAHVHELPSENSQHADAKETP